MGSGGLLHDLRRKSTSDCKGKRSDVANCCVTVVTSIAHPCWVPLLYGNLYVSFSRLIILRGCPKSLSLLGSSAKSREKSCRPTVIAWLVLAKVVPMHVASLLWAIEAGFKRRDSLTVTEKKAYWVLPSAVKSVPHSRVKDIQFSKNPTSKPSPTVKDKSVPAPLETELTNFLSSIKNCSSKPALLSLIPEHSDSYVPKSLDPELPIVLSNLFDKHLADADFLCLLEKAEEVVESLEVDKNQQALVEEKTRDQANSRLWFRMRTGRITASKFKAACRTDPTCPSQSLIMGICHPEMAHFNTEATKWGCQHEGTAREVCCRYQKNRHADFVVTDSGVFISTKHPYLGALPDGMVTCGCCGAGVCKIKVLLCFSVLQERGGVSCYHGKL